VIATRTNRSEGPDRAEVVTMTQADRKELAHDFAIWFAIGVSDAADRIRHEAGWEADPIFHDNDLYPPPDHPSVESSQRDAA